MKSSKTKLVMALAAMVVCGSAAAQASMNLTAGSSGLGGSTTTTTFGVSASVEAGCVIGNSTNMSFGALQMLDSSSGGLSSATNTALASFDATCTNGTVLPQLQFSSQNGGGSEFKMVGGINSDLLTYSLMAGAGEEGAPIAHGTAADFPGFDADGTVRSLFVRGRITASDKAGKTVGNYADTVTITATFTP